MKLVIDTNVLKAYIRLHKERICRLAILVTLLVSFIGAAWVWGTYQPLIRDFVVSNVAHARAGPPLPFEEGEAGYIGDQLHPVGEFWGLSTNSVWVGEQVRLIVPYFSYDKAASTGRYPSLAGIIPLPDSDSFHLGGRMSQTLIGPMVIINERYILDIRWNDKRRALSTLVHELVHVQGGAYLEGTVQERETATQSATVEVLAAMCNHNNDVACGAFWRDVEYFARTSLELRLKEYGAGWFYDSWAKLFWRDADQQDAYLKSMRYWADDPGELERIKRDYSLGPWENIIAGVTKGIPLNTGLAYCEAEAYLECGCPDPDSIVCKVLGMPYNDTYYLMKGLIWWFR